MALRKSMSAASRGFTVLESVISTLIVGSMMVAAMNVVGASETARQYGADKSTGLMLAEELMSEILAMPYKDPESGTVYFGFEPDEPNNGTRHAFDDVDDFCSWQASPPQNADGTEKAGFDLWKRWAQIVRVKHDALSQTMNSETGVKWITVIVERNGREVCRLHAHRADVDGG